MDYIKKVKLSEIRNYTLDKYAFICFASFEERCFSIPKNIDVGKINEAYVLYNSNPEMAEKSKQHLNDIYGKIKGISPVPLEINKPVDVADEIYKIIQKICAAGDTRLIVDITCFTHEILLILISSLYKCKKNFDSIVLLYNGASEYSTWLSKGCKEVRNILGYPGSLKPSQKYHLVVLTGFEKERATRLVELLEPDLLSVGNGIEPTDHKHSNTMEEIRKDFNEWARNLQGVEVESFEFSCSNIFSTTETLNNIIKGNPDHNYIFVPLNTKLSTLSVALVALQNEKIQVCYPIPEVYNTTYSMPSDNVTIIEIDKVLEALQ